jgi:hypothetical protein
LRSPHEKEDAPAGAEQLLRLARFSGARVLFQLLIGA